MTRQLTAGVFSSFRRTSRSWIEHEGSGSWFTQLSSAFSHCCWSHSSFCLVSPHETTQSMIDKLTRYNRFLFLVLYLRKEEDDNESKPTQPTEMSQLQKNDDSWTCSVCDVMSPFCFSDVTAQQRRSRSFRHLESGVQSRARRRAIERTSTTLRRSDASGEQNLSQNIYRATSIQEYSVIICRLNLSRLQQNSMMTSLR